MLPTRPIPPLPSGFPFEAAGGSVAGRTHAAAGRNNQDAFAWLFGDRAWVGVVCDGCSASPHGEVGAQLGARWIAQSLSSQLARRETLDPADLVARSLRQAAGHLRRVARSIGDDLQRVVLDYFLFTVVAALVTPRQARVFAVGDGVVAVNGEVTRLGPFPANEPPYLGYSLFSPSSAAGPQALVCHDGPADSLQSLLLGTDGVGDLAGACERPIPGRAEPVGPLSQFWTDDRFFANADGVRRRLALVARDHARFDSGTSARIREPGLLPDDTTLVVLRRRLP